MLLDQKCARMNQLEIPFSWTMLENSVLLAGTLAPQAGGRSGLTKIFNFQRKLAYPPIVVMLIFNRSSLLLSRNNEFSKIQISFKF